MNARIGDYVNAIAFDGSASQGVLIAEEPGHIVVQGPTNRVRCRPGATMLPDSSLDQDTQIFVYALRKSMDIRYCSKHAERLHGMKPCSECLAACSSRKRPEEMTVAEVEQTMRDLLAANYALTFDLIELWIADLVGRGVWEVEVAYRPDSLLSEAVARARQRSG